MFSYKWVVSFGAIVSCANAKSFVIRKMKKYVVAIFSHIFCLYEHHFHFDRNNCRFSIRAGARSMFVTQLKPRATLPPVVLPRAEIGWPFRPFSVISTTQEEKSVFTGRFLIRQPADSKWQRWWSFALRSFTSLPPALTYLLPFATFPLLWLPV